MYHIIIGDYKRVQTDGHNKNGFLYHLERILFWERKVLMRWDDIGVKGISMFKCYC